MEMRQVLIAEGYVLHAQPVVTQPKMEMRQGLIAVGHAMHARQVSQIYRKVR